MEQPSDFGKQQIEEEAAQKEQLMKERRRLQNRIAQRNHRRRKHNQNKSSSQDLPEETDSQQLPTHVDNLGIYQNPESSWLDSPSFVIPDQAVDPETLGVSNVAGSQENLYAYLSPPDSLSPEAATHNPECPYEANDGCSVAVAPANESLEFDRFEGPNITPDLVPLDAQFLDVSTTPSSDSPLLRRITFSAVKDPSQLYEPNLSSRQTPEATGSYEHFMRTLEPQELPTFMGQSSIENTGLPGPYGNVIDFDSNTQLHYDFLIPPHTGQGNNSDGKIALHLSAERGHASTVRCLIEYGSDISAQDHSGATALHYAAKMGHTSAITALLDNGADGNIKDFQGRTPLHMAAESGHEHAVRLLAESGADVNT
ncbi:GA-binding protein beta chain [Nannizzia gypsea CBS 118893]|uniref:GA-binding protein beta chain n=1 Tax=Arthroderma gypseum (strain ATCC MYA-4604 / CBS 118893) TaxID=535722 RepID=E4USK4_ARTGP|nr:GA-binding protein beta chain [Nannizzia gypsea CBS 118893]EFR01355.1 GA-binding protein beta chain [Nannizzia gypsea CBS 118893]